MSTGLKRLRALSAAVAEAVDRAEKAPDTKGWVRLTIPIESIDHAARELLKLGPEGEVLEPEGLRERMADAARQFADMYS